MKNVLWSLISRGFYWPIAPKNAAHLKASGYRSMNPFVTPVHFPCLVLFLLLAFCRGGFAASLSLSSNCFVTSTNGEIRNGGFAAASTVVDPLVATFGPCADSVGTFSGSAMVSKNGDMGSTV